jgi:hypothetical protein
MAASSLRICLFKLNRSHKILYFKSPSIKEYVNAIYKVLTIAYIRVELKKEDIYTGQCEIILIRT